METNRRIFLQRSGTVAAGLSLLPQWARAGNSQLLIKSGRDIIVRGLTTLNDERIEKLLTQQINQPGDRWDGGLPNRYDLPNAHSTNSFILVLAASYISPFSNYYQSKQLELPLEKAVDCLLRVQYEDGTIDLHTTNFHSTPDTAFLVNYLSPAYVCLKRMKQAGLGGFISKLESFLKNTGKSFLAGGIHTPNHRWVVCSALARLHSFFPNQAYVDRIDEWLGEGIDMDPDGQYTERSASIYSPICNNMFLTMGRILKRPELMDAVRKNLAMSLYYIQPGGEVVTDVSNRQDSARTGYVNQYYFAYRYFAILDKKPEFAAVCALIEKEMPQRIVRYLPYLLEEALFEKELPAPSKIPDQYFKRFSHSGIFRIRRGNTDISIIEHNPTFLSFRQGDAVMQSMRLGAAFFGMGQFEAQETVYDGEKITMKWSLMRPYYQPLPAERRTGENDWEKVPRIERTLSEVQHMFMTVIIRESEGQLKVRAEITGTPHVPVTWELSFRKGGELTGVVEDPEVADAFFLEGGMGSYQLGEDIIRFGEGQTTHRWSQMRGMLPKQEGYSVYLTGYTPFEKEITIS